MSPAVIRQTTRALFECDRCNAFHIGGVDVQDAARTDALTAVCGARWADRTDDELHEVGEARLYSADVAFEQDDERTVGDLA